MKPQHPRVYIAGPISSNPRGHLRTALYWYRRLCLYGFDPYMPHANVLVDPHPDLDWEFWLRQDERWLSVCDAMLRLPGISPGADREWAWAEAHGLPRFRDVHSLRAWHRSPVAWSEDGRIRAAGVTIHHLAPGADDATA